FRLVGFITVRRSYSSSIMLNTLRASWRTGDDGESSFSASRSEAEFTNGIGLVITREGYSLERRVMNDLAAGIAKILVGHAAGQASALGMRSKSLLTVSKSSWDGR